MRFIICVKQVPESNDLKFDPGTNKVLKDGVSTIINPFDQFALEQAIKIRQEGDEIIAISIGDSETRSTLMRCLALGADKAILLDDDNFKDSDTFATSNILAAAINKIGEYNIIFCGNSSFDTGSSQVGPELAALLNIPQITYAESVENVENGKVKVKAQTDDGYRIVESELPLVITGIPASSFQPSIPPLPKILGARKKPFDTWNIEDIEGDKNNFGSGGSLIKIIKLYKPPKREEGIILTDEPNTSVEKLMELLNKDKVI
ncbi:MAG: electron transfer flavoprotein subunit beta/FixA family protein [Candidatus Lokiarchaeota archaeon]|nr:electron transfer flavoprotein subunit beta/FixA family protein [Candidatus Lokiarchaeota archaeon]